MKSIDDQNKEVGAVQLSILMISYNTKEMTLRSLASIYEQAPEFTYEVIVVDNASSDGSAGAVCAAFPSVRLICLTENIGFARANNLAARQAIGEYLLLLNPDTIVLNGTIQKMVSFARARSEFGIVGGRTLHSDGTLNRTSCWGRPTLWSALCQGTGLDSAFRGSRLFDPESLPNWDRDTVREVDIVTGCLLLIPAMLWKLLGGFDPAFFMYGEDADLCLRAKAKGVRCVMYPDARIVHYGGASETVWADKSVRLFCAKALLYRKHWRPFEAWCGVLSLSAWAFSRLVTAWFVRWWLPSMEETYLERREIWRRRWEWSSVSACNLSSGQPKVGSNSEHDDCVQV